MFVRLLASKSDSINASIQINRNFNCSKEVYNFMNNYFIKLEKAEMSLRNFVYKIEREEQF